MLRLDAEVVKARPQKDLLDRTWDFFSSVRVATILLFVIAVAAIGGTLIEQEGAYSSWKLPADYYPERYGPVLGTFLLVTQMTRMYSSWWFLTLLFMLGASLIICSIERLLPLWRTVLHPDPTPDPRFVKGLKQQITARPSDEAAPLAALAAALRGRRYLVIERDGRLYADKGRLGRFGPAITHVGLILILLGGMMRALPGFYFEQMLWVKDGETIKVPNADFYVESERFEAEFYESGQPKSFKTYARILDGAGAELKRATIAMNEPLSFRRMALYQTSYRQEFDQAFIALSDRATGEEVGRITLDLVQPAERYEMAGHELRVLDYFPDFAFDQQGRPSSRSAAVNNPAIIYELRLPTGESFRGWYFIMYPEMEFDAQLPLRLQTTSMAMTATTGLMVKKDLGIPIIYLGLLVTTLGVFTSFYIAHRRCWALLEDGRLIIGAWTNRNRGSLARELAWLGHQLDPAANPLQPRMEGEER